MRFVHFSDNPKLKLEQIAFRNGRECGNRKPCGFWFSDEDEYNSWSAWCVDEGFRIENLQHAYSFDLDLSNYLILSDYNMAREFTLKNLCKDVEPLIIGKRKFELPPSIDWDAVKQKYDGVLLSPYKKEFPGFMRGLDENQSIGQAVSEMDLMMWYSMVDAASGCVWNFDTISNWQKLGNDDPVFDFLKEDKQDYISFQP